MRHLHLASIKKRLVSDENRLDQLAGFTGMGWTASALGFLGTLFGYGNALISNPYSLLSVGAVFLFTTIGLDRLRQKTAESDNTDTPAEETED